VAEQGDRGSMNPNCLQDMTVCVSKEGRKQSKGLYTARPLTTVRISQHPGTLLFYEINEKGRKQPASSLV
jgi:hypothetical protein